MKLSAFMFLLFLSCGVEAQKSDFEYVNFEKADSIAHSYQGSSLKNLPILTYKLTQNLATQVEKFRAIYVWVCSNIESDHGFGEVTLRKRRKLKNDSLSFSDWNRRVLPKVFKRLLNDKKTICSGYAYLIKEMAHLVGIECEIVDGYSRITTRNVGDIDFPNHSWNAVRLNDKWYLVDATMASGFFDIDNNKFIKNYNDGYFLAEPDLFIKKNYPLDSRWKLSENDTSLSQFVEAPIIYSSTFKHGIIPILPKALITEVTVNEEMVFKFKIPDETNIGNIRLVFSGFRSKTIEVNPLSCTNGIIELKYRFSKKGNYDVHLMADTSFVISYTVKVKKYKKQNLLVKSF